jgi:hypothetical protein
MQEEGQPGGAARRSATRKDCAAREMSAYISRDMEFEVDAALLINEGGVHCLPVVFARPLQGGRAIELGPRAYLNDMPVLRLDAALAAERGPGVVAFVLEDAMDARWFLPGDVVRLETR